jgi:membrane protein DedA with SNARE-associated domain
MVIFSAIVYNGMYIMLGFVMGPYWETIANKMGGVRFVILIVILIVIFTLLVKRIVNKKEE